MSRLEKIPTKLLLALVFILLASIIFLLRINQKKVDTVSAWWDETWTYRQAIEIGWTGSDLTDFQVSFDIGTSALIASGKMQTDCDDIRITDSSGNLLAHWIEEGNPGCNSPLGDTKIWTKLPSLPSTGSTIYIYYGNSSAVNVENGNNVFEFFDDFETNTSSDYTITKQVVRGSGPGFIWDTANSQLKSDTSNDCLTIHTDTSLTNLYVWSTAVFNGDNDGVGVFIKSSSTYYEALVNSEHPTATDGIFTRTTGEPSIVSSSTNSLNCLNQTHEIGIGYDGTSFKMYVDGVLEASYNASVIPTSFGLTSEANVPESTYSNLIARKYTTSDPTSTPQSEEVTPGPIAYWKFDEGVGSTAHDSAGNNHGSITGATWASEDKCISGKCLYFDGTADYVNSSTKINKDSFSFSFWFKINQDAISRGTGQRLLTGDGWQLYQHHLNNYLYFYASGARYINWVPSNNEWHHLTCSITDAGDTETDYQATCYGDGQLKNINQSGYLNDTTNIYIGSNAIPIIGFLDEIKIYPYSRTEEQMKADYTAGLAGIGGNSSVNIGGDSTGKSLSDGLVGYWKLEETTSPSIDYSGRGYNATWTGDATSSSGKFGLGIEQTDGGGGYLSVSDTGDPFDVGTNNFSLAMWFKLDSLSSPDAPELLSKRDGGSFCAGSKGYHLRVSYNNEVEFYVEGENDCQEINSANNAIISDTWYHVIAVYDQQNGSKIYINGQQSGNTVALTAGNTDNAGPLRIGMGANAWEMDGKYDEVRIYNRALSASEVKSLYEYAPGPVAHWKMDENSGTTINDSSGNSNNGVFVNSPNWTQGKYGYGISIGNTNSYININQITPAIINKQLTITGWFNIEEFNFIQRLFSLSGSNSPMFGINVNGQFFVHTTTSSGTDTNLPIKNVPTNCRTGWHYLSVTWDTSINTNNINILCDGTIVASGTLVNSINGNFNVSNLWLGNNLQSPIGKFDDLKIYNYARTPKQILEDMNARSDATKSTLPIAHWKFDEGFGTTARDSIGTNHGTFGTGSSAPTWTNNGKIGKALNFNTTNAIIDAGNSSSLYLTNEASFSLWINMTSPCPARYQDLIGRRGTGTNYEIFLKTGTCELGFYNGGSIITTPFIPEINTWYHIIVTANSTSSTIYVNGVKQGTLAVGLGTGAISDSTKIGAVIGSEYFSGLIDEVKIYNYALTADEINQDYNQGFSAVMGQSSSNTGSTAAAGSASQEYCIPGDTSACSPPVAEWKLDEGVGTTAYDTSGNGNHGVFGSGSSAPSWTMGKTGNGLNFDGTNDFIDNTDLTLTGPFTYSFWINNSDTGTRMWSSGTGTQKFGTVGGNFFVRVISSSDNTVAFPSTNTWHHIVLSRDSNNKIDLYINGGSPTRLFSDIAQSGTTYLQIIGRANDGSGQHFQGQIDQVRIYNYARTPAQIAWDYNRGKPIAHYKLDEIEGTTAHDSSGNDLHGTLGTGSSSPTWVTGKLNNAASFDGNDDYISIPSDPSLQITNNFTVTIWFKPTNLTQSQKYIIGKNNDYSIVWEYTDNTAQFYTNGQTGTNPMSYSQITIPNTNWHHISYTYDGINLKSFLNGKLVLNNPITFSCRISSSPLAIGAANDSPTNPVNGLIDDVRIYNYALTPDQIKTLYGNGAVTFR